MTISTQEKKFHAALEAIHDIRRNSYEIRWASDLYRAFDGVDAIMVLLQPWRSHEAGEVGNSILRGPSLKSNLDVRGCSKRQVARAIYEALARCGSDNREEAIDWTIQCLTECECCLHKFKRVRYGLWQDNATGSSGIERIHETSCWKHQPDELIGITSIHETLHDARKEQQRYDARRNGQKVGAV